jgi:hypothetical protein
MPDDTIRASVGMHENGTKNCYNQPADVATIINLLNLSDVAEGGRSDNPLLLAAPGELYRTILKFQQVQNNLGHTPRLSVDGHVDPNGMTLARLNRTARKVGPLGPNDGPVFPPDLPIPSGPASSPVSTNFRIRFIGGLNAGAGVAGDVLFFRIWDIKNNLGLKYSYGGAGAGFGIPKVPVTPTVVGPFTDFTTIRPVPVGIFAGPAHWTSFGGGPSTRNILQIFFIAGLPSGVQMFVETGFTLGAGASSSFGFLVPIGEVARFSGHGV